jgi:CDGSH-type Zn-finger protein
MAQVKITVRPNGPFRVEAPEGSVELVDVNGTPYDLTGKTAFSLCRCGGSINKPFCDGTHSRIGFQGAELAVKKAEGGLVVARRRSARFTRFTTFNSKIHEERATTANWECIADHAP